MRINIYLDRKYCIFVSDSDCVSKDSTKSLYAIEKTVKVRSTFEKLYKLLNMPIRVELVEDAKMCEINVNLSTLVLESEGKRVWNKPIIGSYMCRDSTYFKGAVIKIKSEIICNVQSIPFEADRLMKEISLIK
jgi:hypothetical protein